LTEEMRQKAEAKKRATEVETPSPKLQSDAANKNEEAKQE